MKAVLRILACRAGASGSTGPRSELLRAALALACVALVAGCATTIPPPEVGITDVSNLSNGVALAASDSVVWVGLVTSIGFDEAPNEYHLAAVAPESGITTATLDIGSSRHGISDVEIGFGHVWVAMDPGKVLQVDPQRGEVTARIKVRGSSPYLAAGEDALWVISSGVVQRIDPMSGEVESVPIEDSLGKPQSLAVSAGAVWLVQKKGVSRLDPRTRSVAASIPLEWMSTNPGWLFKPHRHAREIVATSTAVWVADGSDQDIYCSEKYAGTAYKIDPATNSVAASVQLPCGAHLVQGNYAAPIIVYEVLFDRKDKRGDYYEEWIAALDPSTAAVSRQTLVYSGKATGHWSRRSSGGLWRRSTLTTGRDIIWICDEQGLRQVDLVNESIR